MRPTALEVLEVKPVTGRGNLKAFARVRLGAVVIHGCRVIQQPGQKAWVALPQVPARAKADGSGAGWYPVIEITNPELLARVRAAVLEAWGNQSIKAPTRGLSTWDAPRAPPGRTAVHPNKRHDSRQQRINELAAEFDRRGPDPEPPF
jgi:DNA-binding cell septation regulator SpoVG